MAESRLYPDGSTPVPKWPQSRATASVGLEHVASDTRAPTRERVAAAVSDNRRPIGRSFRRVWLSVALSSSGDGMFLTAFPLLAATITREPILIAGVTVASRLPWLLFSMMTGAIADRTDRRRLMVGADIARFFVVIALGLVVLEGASTITFLYACAFLLGVAETFHANAAQAVIPALVEPADLMQANARLNSVQVATSQFLGPPLGTTLFNLARSVPFFADAATFAGSAALIASLPDEHRQEPPTTSLRADMREGIHFMVHHQILRRLALLLGLVNFFYFAAESLLVLYTAERLHSGKFVYTALFIAAACGTVVARFLVVPVAARLGFVRTVTISLWLWAATVAGLAITHSPVLAIALFFGLGIGNGLWAAVTMTLRQQLTPKRLLGRMNAAYRMIAWGVVPLGAAFGGLTAQHFGLQTPFVIAACAHVAVAIAAKPLLRPMADR
ncbi:MAG: hypothetical protein JWM34_3997 [Ilumatobacteraceae bacterium]|nr:hypothetical protein [Ilumatobacteraceae bacterium]